MSAPAAVRVAVPVMRSAPVEGDPLAACRCWCPGWPGRGGCAAGSRSVRGSEVEVSDRPGSAVRTFVCGGRSLRGRAVFQVCAQAADGPQYFGLVVGFLDPGG